MHMKRFSLLMAISLTLLMVDPGWAGFWEKNEVMAQPVAREPGADAGHKAEKKGFLDRIREAGRDLRDYFRSAGKEVKKSSRKLPGELSEGAQEAARDIKGSGKELKQEAKQVPGQVKEGAKEGAQEVGRSFKQMGKDIKEGVKKTLDE